MGEFKYICFFIKKKNETWCGGKVLGYELSIYEKRVCKSSCKGDYMMPVNPRPTPNLGYNIICTGQEYYMYIFLVIWRVLNIFQNSSIVYKMWKMFLKT